MLSASRIGSLSQHKLLVLCDMMVGSVNEVKKRFVSKRKVWKLKENLTRADFENQFRNRPQEDL